MIEAVVVFVAIIVMAFLALRERSKSFVVDVKKYHNDSSPSAVIYGNSERYQSRSYPYSREMLEDVVDAAALVEQRKSGRHVGVDYHYYVNFGLIGKTKDREIINHARWVDKFGARYGVYFHPMDGHREMSEKEKNKILYG